MAAVLGFRGGAHFVDTLVTRAILFLCQLGAVREFVAMFFAVAAEHARVSGFFPQVWFTARFGARRLGRFVKGELHFRRCLGFSRPVWGWRPVFSRPVMSFPGG